MSPNPSNHIPPSHVLNRVLDSLDGLRNLRALTMLLGSFAGAGLLLAMAEASLSAQAGWRGAAHVGMALTVAFYGGNAAGLLVMDDARGVPVRDPLDALRHAFLSAHRLILALVLLLLGYALVVAGVTALMWLCRTSVSGPLIGPVLFGLAVPLGVLVLGLALLSLLVVIVPLAGPAVWSGATTMEVVRDLLYLVRWRLVTVALPMGAVGLLTTIVGALVTFVVAAGGRAVAELGIAVVGVEVPVQQLMAGLFGYGLRSLGASGAPVAASSHGAAALVGGGVVFALALVLPGLVYLRGTCSVYLALKITHRAGEH